MHTYPSCIGASSGRKIHSGSELQDQILRTARSGRSLLNSSIVFKQLQKLSKPWTVFGACLLSPVAQAVILKAVLGSKPCPHVMDSNYERLPAVPSSSASTSAHASTSAPKQASGTSVARSRIPKDAICSQFTDISALKNHSFQATCLRCDQISKRLQPCNAKLHIYSLAGLGIMSCACAILARMHVQ